MPEVCFCEGCANLQRQLREAQEELSAWHQEFAVNSKPYQLDPIEAGKMVQDAEAEARMAKQDLDAAIERGRIACHFVRIKDADVWWFVACLRKANKRAEAVEKLRGYVQHKPDCAIFHFQEGNCDCGLCSLVTPVEAHRAEHRSPQSGQEEGLYYNEDGEEISRSDWHRLQAQQQAEDDLADRAADMPRYNGD